MDIVERLGELRLPNKKYEVVIDAIEEIERLREEKEILKIALQNIKECIAHKGEDEKGRDEMADHAYMVTAIVIGLGSVR
jgi:hypothetical protein